MTSSPCGRCVGKPKDPDYWRKWRAEHPEYRERERQRSRARKRTPEQRRAERERARQRARQQRISDKYEAYVKPWRLKNREAFLAQQRRANRRQYERDPERVREWKRAASKRARDRRYMALARRAVDFIQPDNRDLYHDTLYEDALAEALLSLWANRWRRNRYYSEEDWVSDARDAARAHVKTERLHRWYGSSVVDDDLV